LKSKVKAEVKVKDKIELNPNFEYPPGLLPGRDRQTQAGRKTSEEP
jgi:hypothetical protein